MRLRAGALAGVSSAVVYTGFKASADSLTTALVREGVSAVAYHTGKAQAQRDAVQTAFLEGKIRVVVATVRAGWGGRGCRGGGAGEQGGDCFRGVRGPDSAPHLSNKWLCPAAAGRTPTPARRARPPARTSARRWLSAWASTSQTWGLCCTRACRTGRRPARARDGAAPPWQLPAALQGLVAHGVACLERAAAAWRLGLWDACLVAGPPSAQFACVCKSRAPA